MLTLSAPFDHLHYFSLRESAGERLDSLPYCLRILLENALRQNQTAAVNAILQRGGGGTGEATVSVSPARVLMQDFTGVPVIVDLAALRAETARRGGDPASVSPQIPVDVVVDHSLQVDFTNVPDAIERNLALEYERNRERYALLRWAQQAFDNVRVVPPGKGIIHQINMEYLAKVVCVREQNGVLIAFPDLVFGTDSHTTMVNGLGVLGWGVGGIEAAAAMLGKPMDMLLPEVVGVRLTGSLPAGSSATDLALTIVQRLRAAGVVDAFVEYFGAGAERLAVAERAMIANMTPEMGATAGFFPIDDHTIDYLRLSGRDETQIALVEAYVRAQGLYRDTDALQPHYDRVIDIDLAAIAPSLAGPTRPQDRVALPAMKTAFHTALTAPSTARGFNVSAEHTNDSATVNLDGEEVTLRHGSLLIAAITSCTNTAAPSVMLAAGLLAQKAAARGLTVSPAVKCSLNPGSRVVSAYLKRAGLLEALAELGFAVSGYGCASCIGNAGPLPEALTSAAAENNLVMASIASANRNFEGRISPHTRANYLASPPLVVAFALARRVDIDLATEPLGYDRQGAPVYLSEIYPSADEVQALFAAVTPDLFRESYADLFTGDERWQSLTGGGSVLYQWDERSTYIAEPPYFTLPNHRQTEGSLQGARVLLKLGDSITTDHISPAGVIPADSDAGRWLAERGVRRADFNSYGSRRGNDAVMVRGTFANVRLKNALAGGKEGGYTRCLPGGEICTVFAAAQHYRAAGVPLIVLAGKEYGTGSSRDWAAKGPLLLGVRAILAQSFERIHRANLVGMGVLPLQFLAGESAQTLGLSGEEAYDIAGLDRLVPGGQVSVTARAHDGGATHFRMIARIDTPAELHTYRQGGILPEALLV